MSDGPHRSLPMRPGWKRVAERAGNVAYGTDEVIAAMVPALTQDCRREISPDFLEDIRTVLREQDASLFKDDVRPHIEALRDAAGSGIGRTLLNNVSQILATDALGLETLVDAFAAALKDHAARGARQVEEHYLRKSTAPRAHNTRARIEQASADTQYEALARQLLGFKTAEPLRPALKRQDLDDGVSL
jgi:hypothetical protein